MKNDQDKKAVIAVIGLLIVAVLLCWGFAHVVESKSEFGVDKQCSNAVCPCEDCTCEDCKCGIEPEQQAGAKPHEKLRREIILFSIPNCRDCDTWKRVEQPKFEADGWVVAKSDDAGIGPWPHFIVERNGRSTEYRGYLPFTKVNEVAK
jgi:hypothetical protein